ncbi:hypothetical protein KGMB02408_43500 [Bacteroides faecalis]|uniref:Outer membrane protein beta-barrel domain-containing protein n=2 Tax=Bacteroides faecalis TaxID=2447885 RepID=A0A401M127_9BACE|nr:hypothetical protein KGMB02408_43500 [Bacteroides faecalis]
MNSMKKGLILVLFALISVVSYSQVSWNAKVGMNMSNFTGDAFKDSKMRVGFNVGVGMEYQFSEMWSIQPSLMLTQKGTKVEVNEEDVTAKVKLNPMYLELPIMAAARFAIADNQNIVVKAGPYLAFGISGKMKTSLSGDLEGYSEEDILDYFDLPKDMDLYKDINDGGLGMKRFDFGLGVGVAYEINKFFVDLTGEFGLTKLGDGEGAPKNLNFSIGVGYKF